MWRYLLILLIACGGGSGSAPLDAALDASPDGPVDAPPDAPPDASPDAPSQDPEILAVTTSAGATETRQDAEAHLVITGHNLDGASSVTVGTTSATIDSASATEVRVTLSVPAVIGPQPVTVVASAGTVTKPDAIAVTPFVVSPTGSGGLGTYGSPLGLCDPDLELAFAGDTIELQGGTHECGRWVNLASGVTVTGALGATAIVRGTVDGGFGFAVSYGPDTRTTTIRDLTFAEPLAPASIDVMFGTLVVQRVHDSGGIATWGRPAMIDHYVFDGAGPALDPAASVQLASSTIHCTSGDGIVVHGGGSVTLDGVTIDNCATGLWVDNAPIPAGGATVKGCDFVDNYTGIRITFASATVTDTTIRDDETTLAASSIGLWVDTADVTISTSQIVDQDDVGIRVTSPSPNDGINDSSVYASAIEIVRGRVGISYENMDNNLWLRHSTIRDQTVAAFQAWALDSQTDLGRAGDPGFNTLSVTSGYALDDKRQYESAIDRYIYAHGTTLNGVSFDGQTIDGPAELAPYYWIASGDSGLQF
jgi:hypothetical protein